MLASPLSRALPFASDGDASARSASINVRTLQILQSAGMLAVDDAANCVKPRSLRHLCSFIPY